MKAVLGFQPIRTSKLSRGGHVSLRCVLSSVQFSDQYRTFVQCQHPLLAPAEFAGKVRPAFSPRTGQTQDQWEYRSQSGPGQKNPLGFFADFVGIIVIFARFRGDYTAGARGTRIGLQRRKKPECFRANGRGMEFLQSELSFLQRSRQSGLPASESSVVRSHCCERIGTGSKEKGKCKMVVSPHLHPFPFFLLRSDAVIRISC